MEHQYETAGGVTVHRRATPADGATLAELAIELDERRGGILSSGVEYPGRYTRWHVGYVDPPLELVARGRSLEVRALSARGRVLLPALAEVLRPAREVVSECEKTFTLFIPPGAETFAEEDRSRQPTVFSALRAVVEAFASPSDEHLGLYGAFGYDLAFQFDPVRLKHARDATHRDLVLHLPDELLVWDRRRETCMRYSYDFTVGTGSTVGLPRRTEPSPPAPRRAVPERPPLGRYAQVVRDAKEYFRRGDLFEVVPGQKVYGACDRPAAFYERLRTQNPAPYEFLFNLGAGEFLVGASPEMYVRVAPAVPGVPQRIETCPIAGTIKRGTDALEDAEQIHALLNSTKDESELTMCTDVDRNDKARVCVPGSVRILGRRQIELYSRLIHTVDHLEGLLRPGLDAFDAFLTHMWAVTVTGAPKLWAMQFIEDHEAQPRRWYGGAVGFVGFDGSMNTGLTLRTAHIEGGVAAIQVGATLLFDSDPEAEEAETELKASALLGALTQPASVAVTATPRELPGAGMDVLLVDLEDSFVHTLGDYFRQQGARIRTLRHGHALAALRESSPDLVVLSPGPGQPSDFDCAGLMALLDERELPTFGVCLGMQAMLEARGASLSVLDTPAHGKPGRIRVLGGSLLDGLGEEFTAGRYHSLYATPADVKGYEVTAVCDQVAMAIEDPVRRQWGVQFHPESILTAAGGTGHRLIANLLTLCSLAAVER